MLALMPGVVYAARGSVTSPQQVGRTKALLRRAFESQLDSTGLSIVEVLSSCPVGWGMTATQAMDHIVADVVEVYPLGVIADRIDAARAARSDG
jgi:2-oxoglutarate ferredoxin oxidoreductase subunit beta